MIKNRKLFKRRNFLLTLGALASTVTLASANKLRYYSQVQAQNNPKRDFSVVGNATLRQRAAAKGIIYGAFADHGSLENDHGLASTIVRECGLLVGSFYWPGIQPSINTYNFNDTDYMAKFASDHGLLFRGHPLLWAQHIPQWLYSKLSDPRSKSQEIQQILINHVSTIVKRYAGRMHSWDVVNEAIWPKDGRPDGLIRSQWLNFLGPRYIDLVFRVAAEADPKALLVYNDEGMMYDNDIQEATRVSTLKLLEGLKSRGVPIHALGIQSHLWNDTDRYFNAKKFRKFLADVASLGLKIMITELDVSDNRLPPDIAVRDRIVASFYEDYLSVALDERAVIAVITWGLSDSNTWLSGGLPRKDGLPLRPLPFDSNFKPKLACNALARAFSKAPKR